MTHSRMECWSFTGLPPSNALPLHLPNYLATKLSSRSAARGLAPNPLAADPNRELARRLLPNPRLGWEARPSQGTSFLSTFPLDGLVDQGRKLPLVASKLSLTVHTVYFSSFCSFHRCSINNVFKFRFSFAPFVGFTS